MKINEILELDECQCIEPGFADLTVDSYSELLLEVEADRGLLLVDENEMPLAVGLHSPEGWLVGSFVYRPFRPELIGVLEDLDTEICQSAGEDWTLALREYYSTRLAGDLPPPPEDNRPGRDAMIRDLLNGVWGERISGMHCIDCCCGSGVASGVLRDMGAVPLSYDNDPELLSLGLSAGRLLPEETMHIDATMAARYLPNAEFGIGLMLGDIASFTADMWQNIFRNLLALTDETIISVATEPEIRLVESWCRAEGRDFRVFENECDPIYDRWVCVAGKSQ